jgi:hypothetical protein
MASMNIYLSKIFKFLGLDYPIFILPNTRYKIKMDLDELLQRNNVYIVRRSDLPLNESFNSAKKLKAAAIPLKRIPDLSTNLLGAFFKAKHIKYFVYKPGADAWNGLKVRIKNFNNSYKKAEDSEPIFIEAKELQNIPIPFKAVNNSTNRNRAGNLPFEPNEQNEIQLSGKTQLVHSPTNLNYWHIELKVIDFNNSAIKNSSNKFNESACDFIHDIISECAIMTLPNELYHIDRSYYKN